MIKLHYSEQADGHICDAERWLLKQSDEGPSVIILEFLTNRNDAGRGPPMPDGDSQMTIEEFMKRCPADHPARIAYQKILESAL